MRIIAGEHRGRPLRAPKGIDTRPTTDRVRESLMSTLMSLRGGFDGSVVLDAFAGSGALSFEALSRGASFACLYEVSSEAFRVIEQNARTLGYDRDQVAVRRGDVFKSSILRPSGGRSYDLLFLDPPYAQPLESSISLIRRFDEEGILAPDLIVSFEHALVANGQIESLVGQLDLEVATRKTYGDTVIDIIIRKAVGGL